MTAIQRFWVPVRQNALDQTTYPHTGAVQDYFGLLLGGLARTRLGLYFIEFINTEK